MLALEIRRDRGARPRRRRGIRLPLVLEDRARQVRLAPLRLGDRVERHEDCPPDRRRALRTQPVDRGDHERLVARRRLHDRRVAREGNDADLHALTLLVDESARRRFCGFHAVRLHVLGEHRSRDIDREDDGALLARHRDHRLRPRNGDRHERQRQDEQRGRNVAAPAGSFADGFANEREVRVPECVAVSPPLGEHIEDREAGDDDE